MSHFIEPTDNLADAWRETLAFTNAQPDGTATNVMMTVTQPGHPVRAEALAAVDDVLQRKGKHPVTTVANTLFPSSLYPDPGFDWSPDLTDAEAARLDSAAETLYTEYGRILPSLRRLNGNHSGTYFSRMITWPGNVGNGRNQLDDRIHYLRIAHTNRQMTHNADDIAVSGDAELDDPIVSGIQEYAASDIRQIGFPCLVHIDLSVHAGALSLTAVYRHWHLITRALGNLVGLARLQRFLAQQTGYDAGELVVLAGYANAERSTYGGKSGVDALLAATQVGEPELAVVP